MVIALILAALLEHGLGRTPNQVLLDNESTLSITDMSNLVLTVSSLASEAAHQQEGDSGATKSM